MKQTNLSTINEINNGWMCLVQGSTLAPKVVHVDLPTAKAEAERLAKLVPGKKVCLLRIIGACQASIDVQWGV